MTHRPPPQFRPSWARSPARAGTSDHGLDGPAVHGGEATPAEGHGPLIQVNGPHPHFVPFCVSNDLLSGVAPNLEPSAFGAENPSGAGPSLTPDSGSSVVAERDGHGAPPPSGPWPAPMTCGRTPRLRARTCGCRTSRATIAQTAGSVSLRALPALGRWKWPLPDQSQPAERSSRARGPAPAWLRLPAVCVVMMVIPVALYLFLYQRSRVEEATIRDFRALDDAAERVNQVLAPPAAVGGRALFGITAVSAAGRDPKRHERDSRRLRRLRVRYRQLHNTRTVPRRRGRDSGHRSLCGPEYRATP